MCPLEKTRGLRAARPDSPVILMAELGERSLVRVLRHRGGISRDIALTRSPDLDLSYTPERYQSSVELRGKGNKLRRCPLWPQTASELTLLVKGCSSSERLFLNRCGRPKTCDLNQFLAAIGSNYLPQVQSKPRDFASPPCLRFVFWKH